MIMKQNLDVLVPKYIGTISFVFHLLEQIKGHCVGSWVDVISNRCPRLPKSAVVQHFKRDFQRA